jgi:hypothetical protein
MNFKRILASFRDWLLTTADPLEFLRISRMKSSNDLVNISELVSTFSGSTCFAFATGGSLSNITSLGKVADHNVLMLTTAPIHSFHLFGLLPNLWLIHNPESVRMAVTAIDEYGLRGKIDFSNTYILVPSNRSNSKVRFSSKRMRELRNAIGPAKYVHYTESIYPGNEHPDDYTSGSAIPAHYLQRGHEPISLMNGSSVEAAILPFLAYLGIREVYFGGVDHMDTGHFWDRNDPWQNADGSPKSFDDLEIVRAAGKVALEYTAKIGMSVFRMEETETNLQHYPHINFDRALDRASARIPS